MPIGEFSKMGAENEQHTQEGFPGCIGLYELIFKTLVEKTDSLVENGDRPVIAVLSKAFVNSSSSAYLLTKEGYYEEALTIIRRMLELYEHIVFLFLRPNMVDKWLEGRIEDQDVIRTVMQELTWVKKRLTPLYYYLCKYAHPTSKSIRSLVDPARSRVRRLPMYIAERCSDLLMLLIMMDWLFLYSLKQIFAPLLTDLKSEEIWMLLKTRGDCFPQGFFETMG